MNSTTVTDLWSAVPDELKQVDQWVVWRLEDRDGRQTKMPYDPVSGQPASSTDWTTWTSFDDAVQASGSYSGVGFVFTADDDFCGIDIDDCRDSTTGVLHPDAQAILDRFPTYAEVSPSGSGVKLIAIGGKPGDRCRTTKDGVGYELYDAGRYFTVTGDVLDGHTTVVDCHDEVAKLYGELFDDATTGTTPTWDDQPQATPDAQTIIEKATASKNGADFSRLMAGDTSGYSSGSEADLALASLVSFYTGNSFELWLEVIQQSALWDAKWRRPDYQRKTFEKSLNRSDFFSWDRSTDRFPENTESEPNLSVSLDSDESTARIEPWKRFPSELLSTVPAEYLVAQAEAIGCDSSMVALPLLSSLAAAIGNSRRIELKRGWTEPSIVWSAVVAESGSLKSPAIEAGVAFLHQRQSDAFAQYETDLAQHENDQAQYKAELARWKRRPDGPIPQEPSQPIPDRCLVSDVTVEALAPILQQQPRGVLLAADELGAWLASFNQYKGGKGSDVEKWLELHRAGTITVDRKQAAPLFVRNASVGVCGGIQPDPFKQALGSENFANGLAARLLTAMPPRTAKEWSEREVEPQLLDRMRSTFNALYSLQFDAAGHPVNLGLDGEAKKLWVDFVNDWGRQTANLHGRYAAANAKLESYAARLALVIQLSEAPRSDAVTWPAVERAIELTRWWQRETFRIYRRFTEKPAETAARRLLDFIVAKGGEVSLRDLMRSGPCFKTSGDAEGALKPLIDSGVIRRITIPSATKQGTVFRVVDGEK